MKKKFSLAQPVSVLALIIAILILDIPVYRVIFIYHITELITESVRTLRRKHILSHSDIYCENLQEIDIMPQINSVEDLIRVFGMLFRLAASHPFIISKSNTGRTILIPTKPGLRNCGEIAVIFAFIFYGQNVRLNMVDAEDYISYFALVAVFPTVTMIALASVFIFVFKQHQAVKVFDSFFYVDNELKTLGIHVSYRFWFKMCILYASSLVFIPIVIYFTPTSWVKKIFDIITLHYPVMIRCVYMTLPIVALCVIQERFKQLNKKLNELDDDDDGDCSFVEDEMKKKLLNGHSPFFILDKATKIHARLVETAKYTINELSLILLINIVGNIVQATQAMVIIYAGKYNEIPAIGMALFFFLNNVQVLLLVLLSYYTEYEAANTLTTLGHLNIYYFDQKLAFQKNTLLLQGLHNKVNLNVSGIFPLKGDIFFKQLNACTILFLLILQYYQKSLKG